MMEHHQTLGGRDLAPSKRPYPALLCSRNIITMRTQSAMLGYCHLGKHTWCASTSRLRLPNQADEIGSAPKSAGAAPVMPGPEGWRGSGAFPTAWICCRAWGGSAGSDCGCGYESHRLPCRSYATPHRWTCKDKKTHAHGAITAAMGWGPEKQHHQSALRYPQRRWSDSMGSLNRYMP
jgi:hypothetical protein